VEIRPADVDDVEAVADLLARSFAEYRARYTPEGYRATTRTGPELARRLTEGPTWIAVRDDVVVGTVSARVDGDALYLRSMAVLPEARGAGVGRALLATVEEHAVGLGLQRVWLSTTAVLVDAIDLYERAGFERVDRGPPDLFGTPLFAMEKRLPPGQAGQPSADA